MDKKEVFESVIRMEEQLGQMHHQLGQLKEHLAAVLEENHFLKIENDHLRQLAQTKEQADTLSKNKKTQAKVKKQNKGKDIGEGYDNLARIYEEGFHICHFEYGSVRKQGDCMFCLSLLSGNKQA
ncbi:MAG: DNA replication initiation control protein YabA [Bacilli bacterium]